MRAPERFLEHAVQAELAPWLLPPAADIGVWCAAFGNQQPLHLDIGSGYGRFLLGMAALYPDINFIGLEYKPERVLRIARAARQQRLSNIRLLHAEAYQVLNEYVPAASLSACYIFFPDPWPKRSYQKHRLFRQPNFCTKLVAALQPQGYIYVASDQLDYAAEMQASLAAVPVLQAVDPFVPPASAETDFAQRARLAGLSIGQAGFQKNI